MSAAISPSGKHPDRSLHRTSYSAWPPDGSVTSGSRSLPYESDPDVPEPIRHAACVIAVFSQRDAGIATPTPVPSRGLVAGVYTSSQVEKFGDTLPIGVIQVSTERAIKSGDQSPFFIDVRKRAFIPFIRKFFPSLISLASG